MAYLPLNFLFNLESFHIDAQAKLKNVAKTFVTLQGSQQSPMKQQPKPTSTSVEIASKSEAGTASKPSAAPKSTKERKPSSSQTKTNAQSKLNGHTYRCVVGY